MQLRGKRRGVVLLSTLLLILVIAMFVGSASQIGIRSLFVSGSTASSGAAETAAESGIQYALMQLRVNARWHGDRNGLTLDTPEVVVKEDNGNVVGYLADGSQFRLRFNYQDGDGAENLPDPAMKLDLPYLSLNNVMYSTPAPLPRADGPNASVSEASPRPYSVPEFSVCLIVEGRAGNFTRGDFADTNPRGHASSAVLEAVYRVDDISDIALDAASMSARDFKATLPDGQGSVTVDSRAGSGQPRLRSKGKVEVGGGDGVNYLSPDGQVLSGDNRLHASADGVSVDQEGANSAFYDLSWDQVKHADTGGASLPAGTYVWWDDGSLHYYDLNYKDYTKFIKANPTHPGTALPAMPDGVVLDSANRRLVVKADLNIAAKGRSSLVASADPPEDFAVLPREGAPVAPADLDFSSPETANSSVSLYFAQNPELMREFFLARFGASYEFNVDGGAVDFSFSGADNPETFQLVVGPGGGDNLRSGTDFITSEHQIIESLYFYDDSLASDSRTYLEDNGGLTEGDLQLPGVDDDLSPSDIALAFEPQAGGSATLTAPGNVRVGARLEGQGGSITAGGNVAVVGFGADFAADPQAQSGVSIYARGDVMFSTYKVDKRSGAGSFQDVKVKGVVYSWGDISTRMGHRRLPPEKWGEFLLEGALVAYGGVPGTAETPGTPGSGKGGEIALQAGRTHLTFDPAYLLSVMNVGPANLPMSRTLWNRY